MFMKKFTLFFVLLALIITGTVRAQQSVNDYQKIDYIHIETDQLPSFVAFATGELQAAYQTLVDQGDLNNWRLYYVKYPGGEKSDYNFVSIATSDSLGAFSSLFSSISNSGFIPVGTDASPIKSINNRLIKSELWKVENTAHDSGDPSPSTYMTMDYMDVAPGKNPDYLMLEGEVAKPIHEERIAEDIMAGWAVYSLIVPGGVEYGYNFATGNFYDELGHIEYGFTNEIINQAMGDNTNISELFSTIYSTRDLVKIELWKLAAATN